MKRLAFLLAFVSTAVFAQAFPSKPIRILVPFPAGGTTDVVARLVGQRVSEQVGQPVLVENRAGAGGTIAAAEVARAAPDGYTLLIFNITFPIASVAAALGNRATYNADTDFAGVSIACYVPFVWTAHPTTAGSNLKETMAAVQKDKLRYTYGSTGPGSTMHVLGEALSRAAGVEMTHVPFKGAAPLKQELIAGRINLGGDQLSTSLADIKAGKLKALATSASRRIPELPDVPTVRELGYPVLEAAAAAKHPDVAKRMREMAAEPVGSSGAEQEAIFKRQMDQFRPVIKEMRIEG
ncbi:MAG TPA: tripartite tricarboxylate transporter substrate binding protein [Burkholderiales bacterium]|nr:tripartite tricarboxylate transporter substrate binding protein [Burkholderiales bacterium]